MSKREEAEKLTKVKDQLILLLRGGCPLEAALEFVGIDPSTFTEWMEKGEKEKKGKYHSFHLTVKKALAESEARGYQKIQQSGTWQAERWRLEQIMKEREREREFIPKGVPIDRVSDLVSSIIVDVSTILGSSTELSLILRAIKERFDELMKERRSKKR